MRIRSCFKNESDLYVSAVGGFPHSFGCMLKHLYDKALEFAPTRLFVRSLRLKALNSMGQRDAFADLTSVSQGAKSDLFLDIGCHTGETIQRFRESGVQCEVIGFDPFASNLRAAKTLLDGDKRTRFVEAALSDRDGRDTFFVNRNEQTSSLLDNDIGNEASVAVGSEHVEKLQVSTVTLDKWFLSHGQPDARVLIKCDVQGAEGRVIRGGMQVFKTNVIAFFGEIMLAPMYKNQSSMEELRHLLEDECGLVLFNLYPCFRDESGRAIQTDGLWVRPDCLHLLAK